MPPAWSFAPPGAGSAAGVVGVDFEALGHGQASPQARWIRSPSSRPHGVSRRPAAAGCRGRWNFVGEWKSLPRDASRQAVLQRGVGVAVASAAVWLPVTTSMPRPPCWMNSVMRAYSSIAVKGSGPGGR